MVYGGSLENFCGFVAHRRFESCPLCSSLVGFFHFPCSFLLLSPSLSDMIYLLEREEKGEFYEKITHLPRYTCHRSPACYRFGNRNAICRLLSCQRISQREVRES